jgi:hypothetical protein
MTKSELKSGMMVVHRNGKKAIVMLNPDPPERELIFLDGGFMPLSEYTEKLISIPTHKENEGDYDIVEVMSCGMDICWLFNNEIQPKWKTIWQRKPKPKVMTLAEIEAELGYSVKIKPEDEANG